MPEGPEIRRAADVIEKALKGQKTTTVWFALPRLKRFEAQLTGIEVSTVETRGKAMLTRFTNELVIYSHNQLYGRWYTLPTGQLPETRRQLRLAIHNRQMSALLYSASVIEVLTPKALESHTFLSHLGPDLLDATTTRALLFERLRSKPFRRRQLGTLLSDQSFVAGLGNYLRCEILFSSRLPPSRKAVDCSAGELYLLVEAMVRLSRQSYETGGITNDPTRAQRIMAEGAAFEQARFQVFRRAGLPCYRCGNPIVKVPRGGQPCYLCPVCQRE